MISKISFRLCFAVAVLFTAACGNHSAAIPAINAGGTGRAAIGSHPLGPNLLIQHIVVIIQENRTPDDLFNGFPGADTVQFGRRSDGKLVRLRSQGLVSDDLGHSHQDFVKAYDGGQMDGFNREGGGRHDLAYSFVPRNQTQPYWQLASQYVFGDAMFQSNTGPSFPAHQYLVSGQSHAADNNPNANPWGCDAPSGTLVGLLAKNGQQLDGVFPCFSYPTLAEEMDASTVSWQYYAPPLHRSGSIWSTFDANSQIRYGPDWKKNVISPESRFFQDIANNKLAQVTWIVPSGPNSDHAGLTDGSGPSWVASIVNAVGSSPYWNSTAIFILWDDWGGWYDHVPPQQLDWMGLGFRVPLIVVSPYAKSTYVSHTQHEFGSVLKFMEETFLLPSLGKVDARSDDFADCFNFLQQPRRYVAIKTPLGPRDFMRRPPDFEAPDY